MQSSTNYRMWGEAPKEDEQTKDFNNNDLLTLQERTMQGTFS